MAILDGVAFAESIARPVLAVVVGLSLQRGEARLPRLGNAETLALDEGRPERAAPAARLTSLGVSSAGALANLTSHSRSRG